MSKWVNKHIIRDASKSSISFLPFESQLYYQLTLQHQADCATNDDEAGMVSVNHP